MRQVPGTREYEVAAAQALKAIQDVIPAGLGKKIAAYRNIAMLLNAKTIGRNITANGIYGGVDKGITDYVAAGLDKLVSLKPVSEPALLRNGLNGRGDLRKA